jgi:hypothetical protein
MARLIVIADTPLLGEGHVEMLMDEEVRAQDLADENASLRIIERMASAVLHADGQPEAEGAGWST